MKVTIIPADSAVGVDGRWFFGLNLSQLPAGIHAVWWDTEVGLGPDNAYIGEVQYKNTHNQITSVQLISDALPYESALEAWTIQRDLADAPSPEPTLEERRDIRWQQVKQERKRRVDGGVYVDGHWFHSDVDSRVQLMRLEAKAQKLLATGGSLEDQLDVLGTALSWKTMENGMVPMTAGLAIQIVEAVEVRDALAFACAEAYSAAINLSDAPEEISIETGWPSIYEGS